MSTLQDLKKICEDAEKFRQQVWLSVDLQTESGEETIELLVKNDETRRNLMHAFRRAGITAFHHSGCFGEGVQNIDKPNRKEPFWGTKGIKEEVK
jgi:hypothetical protein